MKSHFTLIFLSAFLLLTNNLSFSSDSYLPSKITLASQLNTEDRYSFYIDYLLGLYQSKDKDLLLYINPKKTLHSPQADELNLGVGIRKVFNDKFILGIHFFYDKKCSINEVYHSQRGYGFEFLSNPIDFRFNYYHPLHGAKLADQGHAFGQQNLLFWQSYEEALKGFDFEFGLPEFLNTRIYLGGFFYDSTLTNDYEGIRVRTETKLTDWFSLDMALEKHHKNEVDFTGGFRITLPFEPGRIFDKKNPFKTTKQTNIKQRLLDRVVRDIDIQTGTTPQKQYRNVPGSTMIYVDNSNDGDALEDGTLSHPHNTLAEAFLNARYGQGVTIYVFKGDGTSEDYEGTFTLADNVTLWGSGFDGGYKGIATSGYPVIDGVGNARTIQLGNNNTIMGLSLANSATAGRRVIQGLGVNGVSIHHNIISVDDIVFDLTSDFGIDFRPTSGTSTGYVYNNTFEVNAANGDATFLRSGGTANVVYYVYNNVININQTGYGVFANSDVVGDSLTTYIFNNLINTNASGTAIYILKNDISYIYNNIFIGIDGVNNSGVTAEIVEEECLAIYNNTITGFYRGLQIGAGVDTFTTTANYQAFIYNNMISGNDNGESGIFIIDNNKMVTDVEIYNNSISGFSAFAGFWLFPLGDSVSNISLYKNSIFDNGAGVMFGSASTGQTTIDLGGGSLGSMGRNSIYNNTTLDVDNDIAGTTIFAENNYWGVTRPAITQFDGDVDYSNWLSSDPN